MKQATTGLYHVRESTIQNFCEEAKYHEDFEDDFGNAELDGTGEKQPIHFSVCYLIFFFKSYILNV